MKIIEPVINILNQLEFILDQMTDGMYNQSLEVLSGSTIGQHTRHILEFYIELNKGYEDGSVNYDKRIRNRDIETNREVAKKNIEEIHNSLLKKDKDLLLFTEYIFSEPILTNYYREIIYNLEHSIHHMAIIRIGLKSISDMTIPEEFGVASSTLRYRKECAQ